MMSHDGLVERMEMRHVILFIGMDRSFYILTDLNHDENRNLSFSNMEPF